MERKRNNGKENSYYGILFTQVNIRITEEIIMNLKFSIVSRENYSVTKENIGFWINFGATLWGFWQCCKARLKNWITNFNKITLCSERRKETSFFYIFHFSNSTLAGQTSAISMCLGFSQLDYCIQNSTLHILRQWDYWNIADDVEKVIPYFLFFFHFNFHFFSTFL